MANKPPDNSEPKNGTPGAASAAHGAAAAGEAGQGQGQAGPAHNEGPKHADDIIAALRVEAADFKDRLLRAHAEVENIRKRSEREKEETAKYAITKLARDIVGVLGVIGPTRLNYARIIPMVDYTARLVGRVLT